MEHQQGIGAGTAVAVAMFLAVAGVGLGLGASTGSAQNQNPCVTGAGISSVFSKDCMVFNANRSTGNVEIWSMKVNPSADTSTLRRLTSDATLDSWFARISPDRSRILFHRLPQGEYANSGQYLDHVTVWVTNADGSSPVLVPKPSGWGAYGHTEWIQRDGTTQLALAGYIDPSGWRVYTLDYQAGAGPIAVTDHYSFDPSWSPKDPDNVLFISCENPATSCSATGQEVYRGPVSGATLGNRTRISNNAATDYDPYLSNAGGQIAWVQQTNLQDNFGFGRWNIWVSDRLGRNARNLTRDTEINSVPQYARWSPDDTWIYFHRIRVPQDSAWGIYRINPGGGGGNGAIKAVLVDSFSNEHPSL